MKTFTGALARFSGLLSTLATVLAVSTISMTTILSPTLATAGILHPFAIYGDDDRIEVYEETDPARQILAESVVAIIDQKDLRSLGGNRIAIDGKTYGEVNELCSSERFVEQTETAYCSAFLVADNVIATAGHCVQDKTFCKDARFVFGYMLDTQSRNPNMVTTDDVYSCRQVLHDEVTGSGSDYALVELDRPVVGRKPLKFASQPASKGDAVFIIGHPSGLPAKVAGGAQILEDLPAYFVANLDAFSGNSGAAVFNENYEVAGVLVRGVRDFVENGTCNVAHRCPAGLCEGEDVSRAEPIIEKLSRFRPNLKISSISKADR